VSNQPKATFKQLTPVSAVPPKHQPTSQYGEVILAFLATDERVCLVEWEWVGSYGRWEVEKLVAGLKTAALKQRAPVRVVQRQFSVYLEREEVTA
jgi:hypothetical protein